MIDDPRTFELTVNGLPAPQGSKSFKGMRGGHAILVESSKKVKPWRAAVKSAAIGALPAGWVPLDGPVALTIWFHMPRPLSAPKTRRVYPATRPDLSKLLRSTEDALTDAGVWQDDSLVVDCHIFERYAIPKTLTRIYQPGDYESPCAVINIQELN